MPHLDQDMDILFKIDGEVEDALAHLCRLNFSFERVHERLQNIEDSLSVAIKTTH